MPTFNPLLKIKPSCDDNASIYQRIKTAGGGGKTQTSAGCKQNVESFQRKVNAQLFPTFSNSSQRNFSDTSLQHTSEDDGYSAEHSDIDNINCTAPRSTKWGVDPSTVPGNLRKLKTKPASEILETFLNFNSLGFDRRFESAKTVSLEIAKANERRKLNKPLNQKTIRPSDNGGIYSSHQEILTAKPVSLSSKPVKNIRPGSHFVSVVGGKESLAKASLLHCKVKSDLSINVAPYLQKSSAPKNSYLSYPTKSSTTKYKNSKKKKATYSSKHANKTRILQGSQHSNVTKDNFTEKQLDLGCDDVPTCSQSDTSKPDYLASSKQVSLSQNAKVRQSIRQQMPKVELKTGREKSQLEQILQDEKLAAKEMKYEMKQKQRREIYALNKVMTELENERFVQFMQNSDSIFA